MRNLLFWATVAMLLCLCRSSAHSQTSIPKVPRPLPVLDQQGEPPSRTDIEHLLGILREERKALEAEWNGISKPGAIRKATIGNDTLKVEIDRLLKRFPNTAPLAPSDIRPDKANDTTKVTEKGSAIPPATEKVILHRDVAKTTTIGDPLSLAQTLLRAGLYADALAAFEKVEIVGMTPEERAPIIYFKASCQVKLGQNAKAIGLFEDVVKVRGDERLVDYARWQLEQLHWHRNVENVLQDIRQRLKASEKTK
jgi:hypothetical protein